MYLTFGWLCHEHKKAASILNPWTSSHDFIDFVCIVYRFAWADSLTHVTYYAILCAVLSKNLSKATATAKAIETRSADAQNSGALRTTHGHFIRIWIFSFLKWSTTFNYCWLVDFLPTGNRQSGVRESVSELQN